MDTPILDFLRRYGESDIARFHMPGHKGKAFLGCEPLDLTEVKGADALYEAEGIIAQSEANAAALFGSGATFYSTEGSTQCIKAMLCLALNCRREGAPPVIVAARNVHKAFVHAAALLDFETVWLWPEESESLCGCPVTAENLDRTLSELPAPPAAVYVTSPDYLGGMADISALAQVCRRHNTILAVDNAHGAYLHFLRPAIHPLDMGADICCDSAHKTLPVLTGGAYLHLAKHLPLQFRERAKQALALFGSTSPSYLTMASLDLANRYLSDGYPDRLAETVKRLEGLRETLRELGWQPENTDPLRVTLRVRDGKAVAELLRQGGVECEYADPEFVVLMCTPENTAEEFERITAALGRNAQPPIEPAALPIATGERVLSVRQALFAPCEPVPVELALGRICGAPTVACPPAIPIAVSGERIGAEALALFQHYGIHTVDVLK